MSARVYGEKAPAKRSMSPTTPIAVDHSARLTEELLLVLGRVPAEALAGTGVASGRAGQRQLIELPPVPGDSRTEGPARVLAVWPIKKGESVHAPALKVGAATLELSESESAVQVGDLQTLVREGLAWMEAAARAAVVDFLVAAVPLPPAPIPAGRGGPQTKELRDAAGLSNRLHLVRQALRERLPVTLTRGGPMAIIDTITAIDDGAFYFRGRVGTNDSELVRFTAISPEGARVEIGNAAFWYELAPSSPDPGTAVTWQGFAAFVECPPSLRRDGWVLELETTSGIALEVAGPKVTRRPADGVREILEDLGHERLPDTELRRSQLRPALRRLMQRVQRESRIDSVLQLGAPPPAPQVSIIVPLYRRIDLVEHQLAHFADDPDLQAADLIFVLDSPELEDQLRDQAVRLHRLYPLAFRVATLTANGGFANANNLGASLARGRVLLLLNSDVFPERPGWLGEMLRFHDSLPAAGAVGPKLLYEDDTLQHAGLYFERRDGTHLWNNEHFYKGMHRDLPAAAESRPVPAVTGACMMIATDLYRSVGGLAGDYIQGDFEDSDLCLRLVEAGRENWYFAGTALYHLEASSYDPSRRNLHDGFNRWLHSHLWEDRILEAQERQATVPLPATNGTSRSNGRKTRQKLGRLVE
ncbi:MAG TPA: glycosyltransferase family 2 protein, partial [Candidatus Solibacter sp.]|nr:glycosyltransferase family 2 protein [Candidatus Solibacter sp.]